MVRVVPRSLYSPCTEVWDKHIPASFREGDGTYCTCHDEGIDSGFEYRFIREERDPISVPIKLKLDFESTYRHGLQICQLLGARRRHLGVS
jgi:hypothetical protein